MIDVFIALGSNQNSPINQINKALDALTNLANCKFCQSSSLYESKAIGPGSQHYINAVAQLKTSLSALALLNELQQIEKKLGREKKERWGDRSIDLDIILYGQQIVDYPHLRIPHPQFHLRNFVTQPLFELVPDLQLPFGISLATLLTRTNADGLRKIDV